MKPVFCQIIESQWEDDNGRLVSTIYALSTEGEVYKFTGRGWYLVPTVILEPK